jgi:transketolase
VERAVAAVELLKARGISAALINMATIKPLDREIVLDAAKKTGCIVTAEEHNIIGGLGSAVAEAVAETLPVPVLRVGVEDAFGRSGPALELLDLYGLNAEHIADAAVRAVAMKNSLK